MVLQEVERLRQEAHKAATVACDAVAELHRVLLETVAALSGPREDLGLVCVDPGHGGHDSGAVDASGRIQEKGVVLDYAQALKEDLEAMGFRVMLTRTDDTFIPLSTRVALANEAKALCFVSVHANAGGSELANGAWVIHDDKTRDPEGKALAVSIFRELANIPGMADKDPEAEVYADGTPWVGSRQLTVVSKTIMPAVLVELGFLTNEEDLSQLLNPLTRVMVSQGIAQGVLGWVRGRAVLG